MIDSNAQTARADAVDIYIQRGIVQGFSQLQIPYLRYFGQLRLEFIGESLVAGEILTDDSHFDGRLRPKVCHVSHQIARLERNRKVGEFPADYPSESFLELRDLDARVFLQRNAHDRFMRSARPQIDSVDRIARGLGADESQRRIDARSADLGADGFEQAVHDVFGALDPGSDRRAYSQS